MRALHFQMCVFHSHVVSEAGLETPSPHSKGRRHSPAPLQPQGHQSLTILPPPHIPAALGTAHHPRSAAHASPITHGHQTPTDPPNPTAGQAVSWEISSCSPCCSLSRLLATFPTQNFPVINIPASWQETCFSCASPLLLTEPFPAAHAPCASPQLFLPAPPRYSRHAAKSAAAKDSKTPCKGSGSTTSCRSGLRSSCTSRSPCLPSKVLLLLFLFDIKQFDKNNSQMEPQPHTHSASSGQHGHSVGAHCTAGGGHKGRGEEGEEE